MRLLGIILITGLAVAGVGCSSTHFTRQLSDGSAVEMKDHRFFLSSKGLNLSALQENDGSFITEWKVDEQKGDAEFLYMIYQMGMTAGKAAATGTP